jgi:hypothetical protein
VQLRIGGMALKTPHACGMTATIIKFIFDSILIQFNLNRFKYLHKIRLD